MPGRGDRSQAAKTPAEKPPLSTGPLSARWDGRRDNFDPGMGRMLFQPAGDTATEHHADAPDPRGSWARRARPAVHGVRDRPRAFLEELALRGKVIADARAPPPPPRIRPCRVTIEVLVVEWSTRSAPKRGALKRRRRTVLSREAAAPVCVQRQTAARGVEGARNSHHRVGRGFDEYQLGAGVIAARNRIPHPGCLRTSTSSPGGPRPGHEAMSAA